MKYQNLNNHLNTKHLNISAAGHEQAAVEAKGMLAHILRHSNVSTPQKPEDIKMAYELVAMPHPKLQLKFEPRSNRS
jgi:hypothetical protein